MNDNDKAAIAAGLFDPDKHEQCGGCTYSILGMQHTHYNCGGPCRHGKWDPHEVGAPDMHGPANWPLAVRNLNARGLSACFHPRWVIIHNEHGDNIAEAPPNAFDVALVALYDAENPEINR